MTAPPSGTGEGAARPPYGTGEGAARPPYGAGEDRALAESWVTRRDEAAFRLLYRRHTPVLWPLVLRMVAGDEEAAREAVQETWVRVAEGVSTFRWESALRTWIVSIALNCAREAVRGERRGRGRHPVGGSGGARGDGPPGGETAGRAARAEREVGSGHAENAPGTPLPDPAPRGRAAAIDLARAIDALPDGYRAVLLLHDLEGYTHQEIAGMLGIETGTSKSQLHRARRRAREFLDAEGDDR